MPALSNHKRELFCQNMVKGLSGAESLRLAGYADNRRNVTRMKTNEDVAQRLAELLDETIPDIKWDRQTLNNVYSGLLIEAKKSKNIAVAAKIADSIAKMNGLVIHRSETGKAGEFDSLSDQELIEILATPLGEEPGAD